MVRRVHRAERAADSFDTFSGGGEEANLFDAFSDGVVRVTFSFDASLDRALGCVVSGGLFDAILERVWRATDSFDKFSDRVRKATNSFDAFSDGAAGRRTCLTRSWKRC